MERIGRVGGWLGMVGGGGCLGERSVDRFQAWYFPDRLNGKGQRLAALVSYEREAICVCVYVRVCVSMGLFMLMCNGKYACVFARHRVKTVFFKSLVMQSHASEKIPVCICVCMHL